MDRRAAVAAAFCLCCLATLVACAGDDGGTTTSLSGGDKGSPTGTAGGATTGSGSGSSAGGASSGDAASTTAVADGTSTGAETGTSTGGPSTSTGTVDAIGCSDGTREGFLDPVAYPEIAGCSGAWDVPGILDTTEPACGGEGGNDGRNLVGKGCTVADLCGTGWHVCVSALEVGSKSPNGCVGSTEDVASNVFFATRQSGVGAGGCSAGANDFHGCGNVGSGGLAAACAPLDRSSGDLCGSLPAPWACPGSAVMEAHQVVKSAPAVGGVLCCVD